MFPDIPVTLEAEPEKVQIVKDLDKFAEDLVQYEIGFKHRWKNWLIKTVAPGEQNIINEKTGSSIEVLSTRIMGKEKVKKTLQEIDRLQPKNMQDYFDKLDLEKPQGIPPHAAIVTGPEAEKIAKKILEHDGVPYPPPHISGYYPEGDKWTAFDNTADEMFMEDFWYKKYAKMYAEDLDKDPFKILEMDEQQKKNEIAKEWEELTFTKMKGVKERSVQELQRVLDYEKSLHDLPPCDQCEKG